MAVLVASSKRFVLILYSIIALGQAAITSPVAMWASSWWVNRSSILLLTGVNAGITAMSEFASRSILADDRKNPDQKFFVTHAATGQTTIHKQSIVNIIMTLVASLLGGPVYFIRRRWPRFMFFITFGAMNSALSQLVAHLIQDGRLGMTLGRFVFDLCYNTTIKFGMFEFARPAILKFRKSVMGIGVVRVTQDFLTTLCRVGMLNWFGF
jgi:hypothetical protein